MRLLRRKKARPEGSVTFMLITAFTLAVGLLVGVIFGQAVFWCKGPDCNPYHRYALVRSPDDGKNAVPIGNDYVADCVPALVRDESKEADVFAQMTDKVIEMKGKVTVADRWFSVDANVGVASLNMVLNPPLVVPPGTPVPVPQPNWDRVNVRTSATIVCNVQENGQCTPSVRPDPVAAWSAMNRSAGLGFRAEYDSPRFDEVRVLFNAKGAIDGGGVTGAGLFPNPPAGSINFTDNSKTLAPAMGEARWHCVWLL